VLLWSWGEKGLGARRATKGDGKNLAVRRRALESSFWRRPRFLVAVALALMGAPFGPHPNLIHLGYLPAGKMFLDLFRLSAESQDLIPEIFGVLWLFALYLEALWILFFALLAPLEARPGRRET